MLKRLPTIWMAAMTVALSYTVTDTYAVLKQVQDNQGDTLIYMEKSARALRDLRDRVKALSARDRAR